MFRITRRRFIRGKESLERVCGITSLSPERADAERLLSLVRGHWRVENRLHWVRDVILREDQCRVRHPVVAQVLAALRNAVVCLLRHSGIPTSAAATEYYAEHRDKAIDALFQRIK